jgi:hypothetical protein
MSSLSPRKENQKRNLVRDLEVTPISLYSKLTSNLSAAKETFRSFGWNPDQKLEQIRDIAEANILKRIQPCEELKDIDLDNLNLSLVAAEFSKGFYDAVLLEILACTLSWLSSDGGIPIPGDVKQVAEWYANPVKIGEDSVEGIVFASSLKGNRSLPVVIKIAKKESTDLSLRHEYFVMVIATNNLKKTIPNFTYGLGAFRCGSPRGESLEICSDIKQPITHVVYEYAGSKSLYEACKTSNYKQVLSYITQIALSIWNAWVDYDFTHFDLHNKNVVLKPWLSNGKVMKKFFIKYAVNPLTKKPLFILADSIAMIIDYGRSHIVFEKVHYGSYHLEEKGISPIKSNPSYDLYKLLGWCTYSMLTFGNAEAYHKLFRLFYWVESNEYKNEAPVRTEKQIYELASSAKTINEFKVLSQSNKFTLQKEVPFEAFVLWILRESDKNSIISPILPPEQTEFNLFSHKSLKSLVEEISEPKVVHKKKVLKPKKKRSSVKKKRSSVKNKRSSVKNKPQAMIISPKKEEKKAMRTSS